MALLIACALITKTIKQSTAAAEVILKVKFIRIAFDTLIPTITLDAPIVKVTARLTDAHLIQKILFTFTLSAIALIALQTIRVQI